MTYIDIELTTDVAAIEQDAYDRLAAAVPGWTPADGNLETWIVRALAEMAADLAALSASVPSEIFAEFGRRIVGIPQLEALPAVASTTWTAVDDAGYTIPAGTQFGVPIAGDELVAFATDDDAVIEPGATVIAGVSAHAVIEGIAANGLAGAAVPIDALAFVAAISVDAPTDGGVDQEAADAYLDRLADEMKLLTPRPILPGDVEILARRSAEVARALALDGYDPDTDTWDNERMTAVALIDASGENVTTPTEDEVLARLEEMRELNFVFKIAEPSYSTINVTLEGMALPGFAPDVVRQGVIDALTAYLEPAAWGSSQLEPLSSSNRWRRVATVRASDLSAQAKAVQGLDFVESLLLAISPTTPASAGDLALPGAAPLTRPGTIDVTIDAP